MSTVTGRRPETEAESKARKAYEKAEAAWLAASWAQDNSRAAELSLQKLDCNDHKYWVLKVQVCLSLTSAEPFRLFQWFRTLNQG